MDDRTVTTRTSTATDGVRLEALESYRVLDTPAERGFDDIVTLATQLCDTPVALVSLVDRNRQWFKARVGFEPCETDLNSSVCRHALGRTDILEIEDLTADPRTKTNPLVTGEPFLRFYAGAPLTTPEGETLGTLCVIDHVARSGGLTDSQRIGLHALANQVMSQLDLRSAIVERDAAMKEREAGRNLALAEAARLEAIIATQQAVASIEADLQAVFQAVVDGALGIIDAADGAVVELRSGDDLVYDTVSGTSGRHKGVRLPIGRTLSGKALLAERPMHCADAENDLAMNHEMAIGLGIRSMVVVPVTRRGEPVGVLKVQSERPNAFSPRDVVMTQMLAGLVASAFGDVAEVKSQRALRRAETRYRQTFESVTEFGVVVTDRDGTITEWNTGAERLFGWTAQEIVGSDAERFFTPEDRAIDRIDVEMKTSLREGSALDERWHLRKDGTRFYASGNMMPLRDDDGQHLGFIKIVRDRTEQHLAGERLRALETQLRQAQTAGGVGLFSVDIPTGVLTGTLEFSRLYGLAHREERPAREVEATIIFEDEALVSTDAGRREGKAILDVEYRIRRPDNGKVRWIARTAEIHKDEAGTPLRFIGTARDITARKSAELSLSASEAKWRGLFKSLQEGFILGRVIRDGAGQVTDWRYEEVNRAWGDLVGIDPARATGRTIRELFPGIEDAWVAEFADVVETGETIRFTRQVGTLRRWYDGVCQRVDESRFSVIFSEVTARVLAERRREALGELGAKLLVAEAPDAIPSVAAGIIGRALDVKRVGYGDVGEDGETFVVPTDWTAEGSPSLAGTYSMSDYGLYADDLRAGRTVVIPDIRLDPRTSTNIGPLESLAVRALVNHPVVENGRTVAILYVNDDQPRNWTAEDVSFVADAADRVRAALERRRAELALVESRTVLATSEAKWRGVFETLEEGFSLGTVIRDTSGRIVDWRYDELNTAWGRLVGIDAAPLIGRTVREAFPEIEDEWVEGLGSVVDTGEAKPFSGRIGVLGRDYEGVAQPSGGETFTTIFVDVTERVRRERRQAAMLRLGDELRDLNDRLAITKAAAECLVAGFEASRAGFAAYDAADDAVEIVTDWCAPGIASVVGRHRLREFGTHVDALRAGQTIAVADIETDERTATGVAALRAIQVGAFLNLPVFDHGVLRSLVFVNQENPHAWSQDELDFVRQVGDRTQAAVARVAAEEQRAVLNAELAHRLKNTLALVQSIAMQTLRTAPDINAARRALSDRIGALAKAHDVLLVGQRDAGDIRTIIRGAVTLHDPNGRVHLAGPAVDIGPKAALTLSLIVHELATNAVKYGALSVDSGVVDVDWSVDVDPETGASDLAFEWREIGGPQVTHPTRKSFGTRLIEMGLSGATESRSVLDYAPSGLHCRLTASLMELQHDEPEPR